MASSISGFFGEFLALFFQKAYFLGVAVGAFFAHLWHRYLAQRLLRKMRHGDRLDLEAKLREFKKHDPKTKQKP